MKSLVTAALLGLAALAGTAAAVDVTIELVTPAEGGLAPLLDYQRMWKSPFGGWGVVSWPFAVSVDGEGILQYRSADQKLLSRTMGTPDADVAGVAAMLDEAMGEENAVKPGDLMVLNVERPSSETVDVTRGKHTLRPFGIEFTVTDTETLACDDKRARVDARARRLQVVCHPVVVKLRAGDRSVAGWIRMSCDNTSLLGGIEAVFTEYDRQTRLEAGTSAKDGFRRVELYLPASAPGVPYEANGVRFEVDASGKVTLAADAKAGCMDGREIRLELPAPTRAAAVAADTRMLGISWFGASGEIRMSCGSESVTANAAGSGEKIKYKQEGEVKFLTIDAGAEIEPRGVSCLTIPVGQADVQLENVSVRVPAATPRWPQAGLIWDVAGGACWIVETGPLHGAPGAEWSCRVSSGAGKAAAPASLKVTLEAVAGGAGGGELALTGDGQGVLRGVLPAKPGLWQLRAADNAGPLGGHSLGLVLIADRAAAAVSMFTLNNRALFRRGDTFDLLWTARRDGKGAAGAEWPVRLRGAALDTVIARIAMPADGRDAAGGRVVVDTSLLAPGAYTVAVDAEGVAGYPFRFRVCQKEQLSDFSVYSFFPVTSMFMPYPGSPANAYVNHGVGGPGLSPFANDGDGSLDAALASYANGPLGPARDVFARPEPRARTAMAMAAMGMRNAPIFPCMMPAEDQNPQHTLPENLMNLRRRLALDVQQAADYPGLDGYGFGWYATTRGFWEYTGRKDGWQGRRNEEYGKVAWAYCQKEMAKFPTNTFSEAQLKEFGKWQGARAWSTTLPRSYNEWLTDVKVIRPGFEMHNHKPTNWLPGGEQYPPMTFENMSHRSALDYHDYCNPPASGWRMPAFLGMGNQAGQKLEMAVFSHMSSSEAVPIVFSGIGRGIDGIYVGYDEDSAWQTAMFRICERFGSYFTALDPLPDVAFYWTGEHGMASTVLYDLARMRRPGMIVSPEDILAGELSRYKVLLLAGTQAFPTPGIDAAVRAFEAKGGVILKDDSCAKDMPGKSIGFAYTGDRVFGGPWGLGGDGEWEHVHPWWKFTSANTNGKERLLIKAFAGTPQLPVTTPDTDVLISPLAGKDSIACLVHNKREVPLAVKGRWRQGHLMPKLGELDVAKGWYVHDLLTGKPAAVEKTATGQRVRLEFTPGGAAIFLLTKREPKSMAIRTERTAPGAVRLTGWLADGSDKPLADAMPFEVTLKGPDGATLFRKFAALGPETPLEVPVPAMAADAKLELVAQDLVLGCTAAQTIVPAAPAAVAARPSADFVGGEKPILEFLSQRKGPVTVVLDEEQAMFRPAAEKIAALLKKSGREARVETWDLAEIRPLYLRWKPTRDDIEVANSLTNGTAWAWRINLSYYAVEAEGVTFDSPEAGYTESGPSLRHEADVVMFGAPQNHLAVKQVEPYLRRKVTDAYPAPGGFFVHHIWSPFLGGYHALYVGCRDAAGADAAVASLAALKRPSSAPAPAPDARPAVVRGGAPAPLKDMARDLDGTYVLGLGFSPSGKKLFATTTSYGDWFFILDPATGKIIEQRLPPVSKDGFPNWWNWGRGIQEVVSETSLRIGLWNGTHLYDLDKGFVSKAPGTPPHHLPGPRDGGGPTVKASTRLDDNERGRIYLGGNDRLHALDVDGRTLWTYEDAFASPDLHYPRGVFPRAVSGDGKVLLVAAFGVHDMMFATAMKCPGVVGIDTATGKLLWKRDGVVLNSGKAVPLQDRFLVFDDDGKSYEIMAADGRTGSGLKGVTGTPNWVLQPPGGGSLLIVENNHFNREGRTSRVYVRPLTGGADRDLPVSARVMTVLTAPDGQSFVIVTREGDVLRFGWDGRLLWSASLPCMTGSITFSPDGRTIAIGGYDGVLSILDAADGKVTRRVDLNFANHVTDERFVNQERFDDVPQDKARTPSPPPPAPSCLTAFDRKKVAFGPNLTPPDAVRSKLKPAGLDASNPARPEYVGRMDEPLSLTVQVKAGATYLVEFLNALADPQDVKAGLRMEVSVTAGQKEWNNLPLLTYQPVRPAMVRRRLAFRADGDGTVTLALRGVRSVTTGEGRKAKTTLENAPGVLLGDLVVSAIEFPARNVLFDGGPTVKAQPAATPVLTGYPHQDGSNTPKIPFQRRDIALKIVNGVIANRGMGWAGGVDDATIDVSFRRPQALSAIAIYEDPDMPSTRYAVSVQNAKTGQWVNLGVVVDNTQGINIFECPDFEIKAISYVWAGRFDGQFKGLGNSTAHIAQFEAYAAEDMLTVDEVMDVKKDALPSL